MDAFGNTIFEFGGCYGDTLDLYDEHFEGNCFIPALEWQVSGLPLTVMGSWRRELVISGILETRQILVGDDRVSGICGTGPFSCCMGALRKAIANSGLDLAVILEARMRVVTELGLSPQIAGLQSWLVGPEDAAPLACELHPNPFSGLRGIAARCLGERLCGEFMRQAENPGGKSPLAVVRCEASAIRRASLEEAIKNLPNDGNGKAEIDAFMERLDSELGKEKPENEPEKEPARMPVEVKTSPGAVEIKPAAALDEEKPEDEQDKPTVPKSPKRIVTVSKDGKFIYVKQLIGREVWRNGKWVQEIPVKYLSSDGLSVSGHGTVVANP